MKKISNWKQKNNSCIDCGKTIWNVSKRCDPCYRFFEASEPIEEKFFKHANKSRKCWEWGGVKFPNGYGSIFFRGRNLLAHRVSYEIHNGPIPKGKLVCHKCDNKSCSNPKHLFIDGAKGNAYDAIKKNLKFGRKKLSTEDVSEIRSSKTQTVAEMSRKFGVHATTINNVISKRTWKFV